MLVKKLYEMPEGRMPLPTPPDTEKKQGIGLLVRIFLLLCRFTAVVSGLANVRDPVRWCSRRG